MPIKTPSERITKIDVQIGRLLYPEARSMQRPKVRLECPTVRPCPFVGCRHNMYLEVNNDLNQPRLTLPAHEPWDQDPERSCSLDIANSPHTLDEIGAIFGVTRERARQIVQNALMKIAAFAPMSLMQDALEPKDYLYLANAREEGEQEP